MKVALIDDEVYALRHTEKLLKAVQAEKPLIYTNPRRALEELPLYRPDILLVDVMMPVMTGLEFAERYLKLCPGATVVILTSYRDFDFAKKSVELGVYDYWLKNELRLGSFWEKWTALVQAAEKKAELRKTWERELVGRVFAGRAKVDEVFPQAADSRYFLLGVRRREGLSEQELADFVQVTESTAFVGGIGVNAGFSFCICRFTEAEDSLWPEILKLARCSIKDTAAVSRPFAQAEAPDAIKAFFDVIHNFRLVSGWVGVPDSEHPEYYRDDPSFLSDFDRAYFGGLAAKIDNHDKAGIYAQLRNLWASPVLLAGNRAALRFSMERLHALADSVAPDSRWAGALRQLDEEAGGMTLRTVQKTVLRIFEGLLAAWNSEKKYTSPFINQAVRYIEDHYADDLHLSLIAQRLAISSDYLRKLFKAETGVGITDYIAQTRLSVARELLKAGAYKVYEVAEMVGYNSAAYFSQAYFKHYGHSPKEGQREQV